MKVIMNMTCPNLNCRSLKFINKDGFYFRKCDSKKIQRYRCQICGTRFSKSTNTLEMYQKKRRENHAVLKLYCSNMSMARIALVLNLNPKTVARKVEYLGLKCRMKNNEFLSLIKDKSISKIQLDDLLTFENTKMKPLTVTAVTDSENRFILSAKVGKVPCSGGLAKASKQKYGPRENQHKKVIEEALSQIQKIVHPRCHIISDKHRYYPRIIKKHFPLSFHETFKSKRAQLMGQGEWKKIVRDPLQKINHVFAEMRAQISRLNRRSWNTTKKMSRLQDHLDMFIYYYNFIYLAKKGYKIPPS